eukprot:COSAG02_NODE_27991_length_598_cov_2.202405_1_plen_181_part_01
MQSLCEFLGRGSSWVGTHACVARARSAQAQRDARRTYASVDTHARHVLVVDNPTRVTIADGLWLLGEATTSGGLILRGSEMHGLTVRNNYISTAASFHTNASSQAYVDSTFILLAELDGKVCDGSTADGVSIGDNDYSDVESLVNAGTYRVPSTEARQSLRLENASVWSFDFGHVLLFPQE